MNGLLLVLKQCFKQMACCFSDSVPLPSFPMLHRSTTLGRPPGPYYRKLVESIVGAVSFPDTLTISCVVLADRYRTKYANACCSPEIIITVWQWRPVLVCVTVSFLVFVDHRFQSVLNRGLRWASVLWHAFTLASICSAVQRRSLLKAVWTLTFTACC